MLPQPSLSPEAKTSQSSLRTAVVQDGARLHYAVPIALQRQGALSVMFSEGFMRRGVTSNLIRSAVGTLSSSRLRAILQRRADEIPPQIVRTNPWLVARQRWVRSSFDTEEAFYDWSSQAVGEWIRRRGIGDANVLFGFVRNIDPRLCGEYRKRGILTVADQMIAPAVVEAAEAAIQNERWPDWQHADRKADLNIVARVEQSTWPELDYITCGSEYVREGLLAQGIEDRRIAVLPYPIDAGRYPHPVDKNYSNAGRPITVGFVGSVNLRKGAPYFLEVARRLKNPQLKFVMVGPVHLSDPIRQMMSDSVELIGRVTREQTVDWMQKFDMLLFPSTCEGNAGAVTEGMASGLPIVTTPNSGTPVRDGIEGFVRNYSDIDGLSECVEKLAADVNLRREMGTAGRKTAESLSLENYGKQLVRVMAEARANPEEL